MPFDSKLLYIQPQFPIQPGCCEDGWEMLAQFKSSLWRLHDKLGSLEGPGSTCANSRFPETTQ